MAQRFKVRWFWAFFLFTGFCIAVNGNFIWAQVAPEAALSAAEAVELDVPEASEHSAEEIRIASERMAWLAEMLGKMPEPPKVDKKIKIPNIQLSKKKS